MPKQLRRTVVEALRGVVDASDAVKLRHARKLRDTANPPMAGRGASPARTMRAVPNGPFP